MVPVGHKWNHVRGWILGSEHFQSYTAPALSELIGAYLSVP